MTVAVDDSIPPSVTLTYSLEQPTKVSSVRVEIWDGSTLLFRARVKDEKVGKAVWKPDFQIPNTPFNLQVKVSVPDDVIATDRSLVLIGTTGSVDDTLDPKLLRDAAILEEGSGTTSLIARGIDLGKQNTVILLMEEESPDVWIAREYLPATLIDLSHVGVDIPSGYLSEPTRLRIKAMSSSDTAEVPVGSQVEDGSDSNLKTFNFKTIYVMSKDRPVLSKIEPSVVKWERDLDAPARLFGSGFTAESRVLASMDDIFDRYDVLTPILISDRELKLSIPSWVLTGPGDEPLRLWVRNGDDRHISDPQFLSVDRTEFGWEGRAGSGGRKWPWIRSVSPYPVPLMDKNGPAGVWLKIYGQNFTKDSALILDNGPLGPTGELKTRFISSQELTAWLPRDLWRRHEIFSSLVAQTAGGTCAAEVRQER